MADADDELSPEDIERARVIFAGPCDFVAGVATLKILPAESLPEVAFAGRSNVGKSSLVNALTGRKTLARTSHTPGRTQQLNFFNLGHHFTLVDMPGYGYAKVSKTQRGAWEKLIRDYLRGRSTLRCVFILVDARHGLKESDAEMMEMLDLAAVPYRIVMTKADKCTKNILAQSEEKILATLKNHTAAFPGVHTTSSEDGTGIASLRALMVNVAGA